jgi:hypothetical protein
MAVEELRIIRCDDCGAVENMPPECHVSVISDELVMPSDWGLLVNNNDQSIKAYCPTCKFLHGF